ncbi:hypothetical protein ACA910_009387 [Epithemia clementina (nom. ined.)]
MIDDETCTDQNVQTLLDKVNNNLLQGMLAAEKKCKPHYRNAYSPKVMKARVHVYFWRSWMTELRTKTELASHRTELAERIKWDAPVLVQPNRAEVHRELRKADKHLCACKTKADELRNELIEELGFYHAQTSNMDASKAV